MQYLEELCTKLPEEERLYVCVDALDQLSPDEHTEELDFFSVDVSFISQTMILPAIANILPSGGELISLIKPQFEVGRALIGKGGIVRKESARKEAIERVKTAAALLGLSFRGVIESPISGGDGNIEYLAYFRKDSL